MKNGEALMRKSKEEREYAIEQYNKHPLKGYIDWERYFNSEDGNEMHFVRAIDVYQTEENGTVYTVYILSKIESEGMEYCNIYIPENEDFYMIPQEAI